MISEGMNQVATNHDPTAHAEIVAIRAACRALGTFQLTGCTLFCSCEPCPMCLGAIYWARLDAVYFASTRDDAANAGFDDAMIYKEVLAPPESRQIPMCRLHVDEAALPFQHWKALESRVQY